MFKSVTLTLGVLLVAGVLGGCTRHHDDAVTPSALSANGTWDITLTYSDNACTPGGATGAATMTLTQGNHGAITGWFGFGAVTAGSITGQLSGNTITFTIDQTYPCTG